MLIIQKMIAAFFTIPGIFLVIGAFSLLVFRKRLPRSFLWTGWILLVFSYLLCTDFAVRSIVFPLEDLHPPVSVDQIRPESGVIVILGGGVLRAVSSSLNDQPGEAIGLISLQRLLGGFRLYQITEMDIYLSGGVLETESGRAESRVMEQILIEWGVPQDKIIVEPESRTTMENALFVMETLPESVEHIHLVTSATHMARSVMSYQKAAQLSHRTITIIPVPSGYAMDRGPLFWYHFLPSIGSLNALANAFHEYIGILFYSFR